MSEAEDIKKEVNKLRRIETTPHTEDVELRVMKSKNTHKKTNKTFTQYKMNLPKEILDTITSNDTKDATVNSTFDSSKNKLTIEIW